MIYCIFLALLYFTVLFSVKIHEAVMGELVIIFTDRLVHPSPVALMIIAVILFHFVTTNM